MCQGTPTPRAGELLGDCDVGEAPHSCKKIRGKKWCFPEIHLGETYIYIYNIPPISNSLNGSEVFLSFRCLKKFWDTERRAHHLINKAWIDIFWGDNFSPNGFQWSIRWCLKLAIPVVNGYLVIKVGSLDWCFKLLVPQAEEISPKWPPPTFRNWLSMTFGVFQVNFFLVKHQSSKQQFCVFIGWIEMEVDTLSKSDISNAS